jgi:hypothetical protein
MCQHPRRSSKSLLIANKLLKNTTKRKLRKRRRKNLGRQEKLTTEKSTGRKMVKIEVWKTP